MARVLLGLGTNVGARAANLRAALLALREQVLITAVSDVYESAPFGHLDQPHFWNLAVSATSDAAPEKLLHALQQLETRLGRVPSFRMGPRLIDIDILLFDDVVMETPVLTIPHPGIVERNFVLRPLLDLEPELRHPVSLLKLEEHLERIGSAGLVRLGDAAMVLGGIDARTS